MSDSVVDDLITAMDEDGFGTAGRDIFDWSVMTKRAPSSGILVRQRTSAPAPDPLIRCDTALLTVTVMGAGNGDLARERAGRTAQAIYKRYGLCSQRTINQTQYLSIEADAAPYEQDAGDRTDYVLGIRMVRFYGGKNRWHTDRKEI